MSDGNILGTPRFLAPEDRSKLIRKSYDVSHFTREQIDRFDAFVNQLYAPTPPTLASEVKQTAPAQPVRKKRRTDLAECWVKLEGLGSSVRSTLD